MTMNKSASPVVSDPHSNTRSDHDPRYFSPSRSSERRPLLSSKDSDTKSEHDAEPRTFISDGRSVRELYKLKDGTCQVRACIFELDGLVVNTPDITLACHDIVLERLRIPALTIEIRAEIQGISHDEAVSYIMSHDKYRHLVDFVPGFNYQDYISRLRMEISQLSPNTCFMPGTHQVIHTLTKKNCGLPVSLALVSNSLETAVRVKMQNLKPTLDVFPPSCRLYGGDPPLKGRGKPHPYIFQLALQRMNESLPEGEPVITKEECLVFDTEIAGVRAALAAGMRVVWVPHPDFAWYYGIGEQSEETSLNDGLPPYLRKNLAFPATPVRSSREASSSSISQNVPMTTTPVHVQRQISLSTFGRSTRRRHFPENIDNSPTNDNPTSGSNRSNRQGFRRLTNESGTNESVHSTGSMNSHLTNTSTLSGQDMAPTVAQLEDANLMRAWKMEGLEEKYQENALRLASMEDFPWKKYGLQEKTVHLIGYNCDSL